MAAKKTHVSARGGTSIAGELARLRVSKVLPLEKMHGGVRRHIDKADRLMVEIGDHVTVYPDLSAQADNLIASAKSQFSGLLKAQEIAEQDKENFRLEHMLSRNPHSPSPRSKPLKWAARVCWKRSSTPDFSRRRI